MKLPKDLRGIAISAAILGGNVVLTYCTTAVLTRALGLQTFGAYSLIIAIVTTLTIPAIFGLPTLVSREVAVANAQGQPGLMRGLIIRSHQAVLGLAGIAIILGAAWFLVAGLGPSYFLGLPLILLLSLSAVRSAMLRGIGRVQTGQWPEQLLRPFLLMAFVLFLWWRFGFISIEAALVATVLSAFVAPAVNLVQWWRMRPKEVSAASPIYRDAAWLKAVLPFALSSGMLVLSTQVALLLCGWLGSAEQVALFKVAAQTAQLCALGYTAAVMNISPALAAAATTHNRDAMASIARRGAAFATVLSLPPALIMIAGGKPLLQLLFGAEYGEASVALGILVVGQIANALFGCGAALLNMSGHEQDVTWGLAAGVVAQLAISLTLIPFVGANGAAIGSVAGVLASNALLVWRSRHHLGVDPTVWATLRGKR